MLARLEEVAGISSAAVDHSGELLRLIVSDGGTLDEARRALAELGYEATMAEPAAVGNRRWYEQGAVRDLSREEAKVIADRVVKPFGARWGLAPDVVDSLTAVATTALYECFAAHRLGSDAVAGSVTNRCSDAVMSAAAPVIGEDAARDLASAVQSDLSAADRASQS